MDQTKLVAFLVDDDPSVLRSLTKLLTTVGYDVRPYSRAEDFLSNHDPSVPGCAILDVSMPGLNGLELQEALALKHPDRPVIFLSGSANVPVSVSAMKAGAVDFLTKPIDASVLLTAIATACDRNTKTREMEERHDSACLRLSSLTRREHQVLEGVVAGRLNKQIAGDLGISLKTIKMHRGSMMRKMKVRSVADLVRLVALAETPHQPSTTH